MAQRAAADETDKVEKLGNRPGLDGIRGVAILLVLGAHAHYLTGGPRLPGGFVGVDVFFVLSGFLITRLIIDRWDDGDRSLGRFYERRARRLLPGAVAVIVAVSLVQGFGWPTVAALGYFTNWAQTVDIGHGGLDHFWSLAIEEQFYLVWPPLLMVALGKRCDPAKLAVSLVAVAAVIVAWRWTTPSDLHDVYRSTHTRGDGLLIGCAAALLWHRVTRVPLAVVVAGGAVIVGAAVLLRPTGGATFTFGLVAVNVAAAVVVVAATRRTPSGPVVDALGRLGRYAYSIYLWHYPIFRAVQGHRYAVVIGVAGVAIAAGLSHRFIERPFRRANDLLRVDEHRDDAVSPVRVVRRINVTDHRPHLNVTGDGPRPSPDRR
jgi:peptidoglycan/LPS O-acetylase OafA/YrhL